MRDLASFSVPYCEPLFPKALIPPPSGVRKLRQLVSSDLGFRRIPGNPKGGGDEADQWNRDSREQWISYLGVTVAHDPRPRHILGDDGCVMSSHIYQKVRLIVLWCRSNKSLDRSRTTHPFRGRTLGPARNGNPLFPATAGWMMGSINGHNIEPLART